MKAARWSAIRSLVRDKRMTGHRQLQAELARLGFIVTQATISRDLSALGLVKVKKGKESFYSLPEIDEARRMLKAFVTEVDLAGNLGVVKTIPGGAQGVGATFDKLGWPELVGTIAGDDTILLIFRDKKGASHVCEQLTRLKGD